MLKIRIDIFNPNKLDKFMVKNIDRLLYCFDENFDIIFESKPTNVSNDIKRVYLDIDLDNYCIGTSVRKHSSVFKFNIRVDGNEQDVDVFSKWLKGNFIVKSESSFQKIQGTPYMRKLFTVDVKGPRKRINKTNKQSKSRNYNNPYDNFREIPSSVGIKFYGTKP